jgi:hypothetical protein
MGALSALDMDRGMIPSHTMITRIPGRIEAILPADQWLIVHSSTNNKQRASVYEAKGADLQVEVIVAAQQLAYM